jgi:hypothetical protein
MSGISVIYPTGLDKQIKTKVDYVLLMQIFTNVTLSITKQKNSLY